MRAVIGNNVRTIGRAAFFDCEKLSTLILPESLQTIEEVAFRCCESLTSLHLGNALSTIGFGAFNACHGLSSVTVPASVTSIGDWAFSYGTAEILVSPENSHYISIDGNLYSGDGKTLLQYAAGKKDVSFTVPDHITKIANSAFLYCENLREIILHKTITTIGNNAFHGCKQLERFVIPDSVTEIDSDTFQYCENLSHVTVGSAVTRIGIDAFYGCENLNTMIYNGKTKDFRKIHILNDLTKQTPLQEVKCQNGVLSLLSIQNGGKS
jgi:hypothetical protein